MQELIIALFVLTMLNSLFTNPQKAYEKAESKQIERLIYTIREEIQLLEEIKEEIKKEK